MQKKSYILPCTVVIISIVAVLLRVYQLLTVVDYNEMGFFVTSTDISGFLAVNGLYLLMGFNVILLIIGAIIDKKIGGNSFTRPAASLTPKQAVVLGAAFLIGACLRIYDLMLYFNKPKPDLGFISEVLIFVLYLVMGFIILGSKRFKPAVGYLHIVICISYTLKAAVLFMQDTIIVRVSDELLLLLSYVASVLFFLALGRFITGNESRLTRHKLFIFGGFTVLLSLCASLAGYIALFINTNQIRQHMTMHPLSETGTALVALTVIFTIYSSKALPVPVENDESNEGNEMP